MKSTGEALGMGLNYQEALHKSVPSMDENSDNNYIFCSISDRDKTASLPIIKELLKTNYRIAATAGTALFFQSHGISIERVIKDDGDVNELFRKQSIKLVINIPNQGRKKHKFGFQIREHAVRYKIPVFTHLDTIEASIGLQNHSLSDYEVRTVSEYYNFEERGAIHVRSN